MVSSRHGEFLPGSYIRVMSGKYMSVDIRVGKWLRILGKVEEGSGRKFHLDIIIIRHDDTETNIQ